MSRVALNVARKELKEAYREGVLKTMRDDIKTLDDDIGKINKNIDVIELEVKQLQSAQDFLENEQNMPVADGGG